MILILEIINNTTVHLVNETSNIVYGTFLIGGVAGTVAAVAIGGSLLKTGISALGIGKKKREAAEKQKKVDEKVAALENYDFENAYADMEGAEYDIEKAQMAELGAAAQLGDADKLGQAQGYKAGQLGKARGYSAQGYEGEGYTSQGYSAQGTNISGLARGANTGLTNTMNNLQVSTAAAEMQAQEADQSLAASQDLAAQAGTGAGGATALAAAAAKSKQGVASSIDQQVKSNEQLRARGESELQRAQLAQGNTASQFDLGQSQFNTSAVNQAAQFGASAANQASQFGAAARNESNRFTADAMNQAGRFKAQAQNQFAQSQFAADNAASQFSAGAQNQFSMADTAAQNQFRMADVGSQNQFGLAEFGAANSMNQFNAGNQTQANQFGANTDFQARQLAAGGEMTVQGREYGQLSDAANIAGGQSANANNMLANQKAQITGAAMGVVDSVGNAITSDRRLKKDIKLIGISPSGLKIYNFKYKNAKEVYQGVMSDEIPKEAIVKHKDGFDRVNYSMLDVEFKLIK
tara:strand:- start:1151 stop:2719 length:1569 start_codon:yes stop_codon:yes gene_type:complete